MHMDSRFCDSSEKGEIIMQITGKSLIAGEWTGQAEQSCFNSFSPAENETLPQQFYQATEAQLEQAVIAASEAFRSYRKTTPEQRAAFLENIADEILNLGDELLQLTHKETALPMARLQGERGRTVNQLRAFAQGLRDPLDKVIEDSADPDRQPQPKPATVLEMLPLGPVAVFGASNFPYAFSTLGGDTASALAAGCPVVVKAHPAHPGTGELMARAISSAIARCDMHPGVFSMLQSSEPHLSHQLVKASGIKAVGFTGSHAVAKQLQKTITQRSEPIPFYGELGSINPQVVLTQLAEAQATELAEGLCQSMLMGNGQFCTSPGVWFVPAGCEEFNRAAQTYLSQQSSGPLLTPGILQSYRQQTETLSINPKLKVLARGKQDKAYHAQAHLFCAKGEDFVANTQLRQEVFGPGALIVTYDSHSQLLQMIESLEGQLTASFHGTSLDIQESADLIESMSYKVGRLIFNQMPTGVEVCASMNHGGPYPASTDVRTTSVGLTAMRRFQRPICYQNRSKN
jgi:2,5-dioxopentanoate dehydrogenase